MPPQREHAICLRHAEWSETSQVVTLLTQHTGLVRGLAKGATRPRAPYSGGFETLTRGEIVYFPKREGLSTLAAWDVTDTARAFRNDLTAQRLGLYAVDLAAHLILDHDPHPRSYAALAALLEQLRTNTAIEPRLRALATFHTAILHEIGLLPDWGEITTELDDTARPPRVYLFTPQTGRLTPQPERSRGDTAEPGWAVRASTVVLLRELAAAIGELDRGRPRSATPPPTKTGDAEATAVAARAVALLDAWCAVSIGKKVPTSGVLEASLSQAGWRPTRDEVPRAASR